jgi:hypothetical protein
MPKPTNKHVKDFITDGLKTQPSSEQDVKAWLDRHPAVSKAKLPDVLNALTIAEIILAARATMDD